MYLSFSVSNFRGIHSLSISHLSDLNLVVGKNNVGKTALLEALFVHSGGGNPSLALAVQGFRATELGRIELGLASTPPWESLFADLDMTHPIIFESEERENRFRVTQIQPVLDADLSKLYARLQKPADPQTQSWPRPALPPSVLTLISEEPRRSRQSAQKPRRRAQSYLILDEQGPRVFPFPATPPFQTFFVSDTAHATINEDSELYGRLARGKTEHLLLDSLRKIEPHLKDVREVSSGGQPMLMADIGLDRLIPLSVMGGGILRLSRLLIRIANAENGVVLVDEIDNGFHHSALPSLWRVVSQSATRSNVQIIATTHSLECIKAAHQVFLEQFDTTFELHRIDRRNGKLVCTSYDTEILGAAIDSELEVR